MPPQGSTDLEKLARLARQVLGCAREITLLAAHVQNDLGSGAYGERSGERRPSSESSALGAAYGIAALVAKQPGIGRAKLLDTVRRGGASRDQVWDVARRMDRAGIIEIRTESTGGRPRESLYPAMAPDEANPRIARLIASLDEPEPEPPASLDPPAGLELPAFPEEPDAWIAEQEALARARGEIR